MCLSCILTHTISWTGVVQIPLDGCEQETLAELMPATNSDKSGEEWRNKIKEEYFQYTLHFFINNVHHHTQTSTNGHQKHKQFTDDKDTENPIYRYA